MTTIALDGVTVAFPGPEGLVAALNNVSLTISAGEFVIVVGPNGSGKTTLLDVIAGEISPTRGRVRCTSAGRRARPAIARLSQNPTSMLAATLTVDEHLVLAYLRNRRLPFWKSIYTDGLRTRAREELRTFTTVEDLPPKRSAAALSGGRRQLLAACMAYLQRPDAVLLDEPTASLDAPTTNAFMAFVHAWWQQAQPTILMVTHDLRIASEYGTRLLLLKPGQTVAFTSMHGEQRNPSAIAAALYEGVGG